MSDWGELVPDGFWERRDLTAALACYDFGAVFRTVRTTAKLSQRELGELIGLEQSRVSAVERGKHHLRDIALIARIAAALSIPAHHLGFSVDPRGSVEDGGKVDPVDRREFVGLVMAVALGSGIDPDRLEALLSTAPPRPDRSRRIGASDVASIERLTATLRAEYYAVGSGLGRTAAVAPLRELHTWIREATCTDEVRKRLVRAAADLAWVGGWASWDAGADVDARRVWTYALQRARSAEDPDLTVAILLDLSYRALTGGRGMAGGPSDNGPKAALSITTLASTVIDTSDQPVSPHILSDLHAHRAWCYASMGAPEQAEAALKQEEDTFAADRNGAPPWARHVSTAEVASHRAHASALLARTRPPKVDTAIEQLNDIIRNDALAYPRTMAFHLPDLSACYFRIGDISSAVSTGKNAVAAAKNLSSQHALRRLHVISNAVAPPQRKSADVAQLLNRIQANST